MATEPKRMSRRAILAAAGVTPAVLFAAEVSAADARRIESQATRSASAGVNVAKYAKVWVHLYGAFALGVSKVTGVGIGGEVLDRAFALSGQKIQQNLAGFSTDGHETQTLVCAFLCGVFAASLTHSSPTPKVIDVATFETAWSAMAGTMSVLFQRVAAQGEQTGEIKIQGLAC